MVVLMRKLGFLVALATVGSLFAAGTAVVGAQTQPTPDVTAFCDAGLKVDRAINAASQSNRPTQKQLQAVTSALDQAQTAAPGDIAPDVQSIAAIIQNAIQNNQNATQNPTFEQNLTAISQYRYNNCGYNQVQVTGTEYAFQGLPKTLPAGKTAIQFTDTGAELHMLAVFRVKTTDSVKNLLQQGRKAAKKIQTVGEADVTTLGGTAYVFADLKPGRYGAVCFFPVGATDPSKLNNPNGTPHWKKGMYQEFKVKAGATTTT